MKTFALLSAALLGTALARCPNGCSNQGLCGPNSQCKCYRNFQGSDCSERVCYYALSFIDTPAGDLNGDGAISMTVTYEEGTQDYALEGYSINYGAARPVDGASESGRWDEGHFYAECSNKGICNRKTGQCSCFPGYEGEGCQRTTCPGTSAGVTCSGHGLCLNAYHDKPTYALWDKEKTMKCECDKGYSGPDCSIRQCPMGPDPVKHSDKVTTSLQKIAFGAFTYESAYLAKKGASVHDKHPFDQVLNGPMYFTVTVTDDFGDEWTTNTLSIEYTTSCTTNSLTGEGEASKCRSKPIFNKAAVPKFVELDPKKKKSDNVAYNKNFFNLERAQGYAYQSDPENFDWYATNTIADDLNISLQGLPNGAVKEPYVWMWYTDNSQQFKKDTNTADMKTLTVAEITEQPVKTEKAIYDAEHAKLAKDGDAIEPVVNAMKLIWTSHKTLRSADIKYPSALYEGKALYWQSPRTRYPDFNSNGDLDKKWHDCGRVDATEDVNADGQNLAGAGRANKAAAGFDLVHSTEGLCLYISTANKITKNFRVTYMYNSHVLSALTPPTKSAAATATVGFIGQTQVGESVEVKTTALDSTGTQSFLSDNVPASNLIAGEEPIVTVEEVGLYRYWDVNVDGYPERSYNTGADPSSPVSTFETHECSKRGLCDESTGECRCFSGYTGTACNAQNAISYSS